MIHRRISMSANEIGKLKSYLTPEDIMLEWGAGGSTLYFSNFIKEYYSIEHSKEWFNNINKGLTEDNNQTVSLILIEPDEKKIGIENKFKDYIKIVHQINKNYDKVLIDGRARVACAIEVLPYINKKSVVFLHDIERPRYKKVLEYYNIISIEGRLGVLRKK